MQLGLERMREACARAGHPELALSVVHVAGTNGKGSVCAMLEAMALAAGRRVGLYTSPHLCRFVERIRVDGAPIDDDALETHLGAALELGPELSFFETATLAALLALRAANVELAILEVGIGGRLDATNVVPSPRVCAITRIALDHTELLGDTLEAIAREKAAIAKAGVPMLVGPVPANVRREIERACSEAGAPARFVDDDPALGRSVHHASIGLAGAHQKDNARIAWALGEALGLPEETRVRGLARVRWPGRLETIETPEGPVLLDAAHNPDGAVSLGAHLSQLAPDARRVALVFGTLADKAWPEMIDGLAPRAAHHVYVTPKGRAATDPAAIASRHAGVVASSVADALEKARAAVGPGGLVVACGSVYLIGEARAQLLGLERDPPVAL
jgi:dihydrofolate synthase/folylpolyglutamate synthase